MSIPLLSFQPATAYYVYALLTSPAGVWITPADTNGTSGVTLTVVDGSGATLINAAAATYSSLQAAYYGYWIWGLNAAQLSGIAPLTMTIRQYASDGTTLQQTIDTLLFPTASPRATSFRGSINRVETVALSDVITSGGSYPNATSATEAARISAIGPNGATLLAATAMTYVSPGVWQYDLSAAAFAAGNQVTVTVQEYDQTLTTLYQTLTLQCVDGG